MDNVRSPVVHPLILAGNPRAYISLLVFILKYILALETIIMSLIKKRTHLTRIDKHFHFLSVSIIFQLTNVPTFPGRLLGAMGDVERTLK